MGPIVSTATGGSGLPGEDVIIPGTFSPGHSPGTALYGSLELVDTTHLIMELGGRNPGEYDHIAVDGLLVFDGLLEVRLLYGFMPADGDRFDLFDWGSSSGRFDDIMLPTLLPGLAWDVSDLYVTGEIAVVDPPIDAVPAPSSLTVLLLGLAIVACRYVRIVPSTPRASRVDSAKL